jgi:hypothetical protein
MRGIHQEMRIFLVDFLVSGHHVEYASYLSRYFREHGHEVTFWTWGPDKRLQVLSDIRVNIRYPMNGKIVLPNQTFYMIPLFSRGLHSCFKTAVKEQADIIHLLYLNRAMPLPFW